jgi:hypothetical protein
MLSTMSLPTVLKRVFGQLHHPLPPARQAPVRAPEPSAVVAALPGLPAEQSDGGFGCDDAVCRAGRTARRISSADVRDWLSVQPADVLRRLCDGTADGEARAARLLAIRQRVCLDLGMTIPEEVTRLLLAHVPLWWAMPVAHAALLLNELTCAYLRQVFPADFRAVSQWLMRGQSRHVGHDLDWNEARVLARADRTIGGQ